MFLCIKMLYGWLREATNQRSVFIISFGAKTRRVYKLHLKHFKEIIRFKLMQKVVAHGNTCSFLAENHYVDGQMSVLKGMFEKRRKGYKALGYEIAGVG